MKAHIIQGIKKYYPLSFREPTEKLLGRKVYHPKFDKYKCIFIHIPKTAGSSIGDALFGTDLTGHWTANTFKWTNPHKFTSYFKFAFVRNPWDRVASSYHYLKMGGKTRSDATWALKNMAEFDSFEDFVLYGLHKNHILNWVHFRSQLEFIKDENDNIALDFLGRFENIAEDFEYINRKIGTKRPLPHRNNSDRPPYTELYTPAMAKKVSIIYKEDIHQLNYCF